LLYCFSSCPQEAALKDVLRDGYARASRLLVALKRHGKQSEVLRSALTSLRQLQGLSG
jgi:hypothetical protein